MDFHEEYNTSKNLIYEISSKSYSTIYFCGWDLFEKFLHFLFYWTGNYFFKSKIRILIFISWTFYKMEFKDTKTTFFDNNFYPQMLAPNASSTWIQWLHEIPCERFWKRIQPNKERKIMVWLMILFSHLKFNLIATNYELETRILNY